MEQYFDSVVSALSIDDLSVLRILHQSEATESYRSMITGEVLKRSGLSAATYRKIIHRLIGNKFIQVVILNRQHTLYLTRYGVEGLKRAISKKDDIPNVIPIRVITSSNLAVREPHERKQEEHDDGEISQAEALSIINV